MGMPLTNSEFPCYLVWPFKDRRAYILVDTNLQNYLGLTAETYFRPLGLQHFYAAFALDTNVSLRADVLTQFQPKDVITLDQSEIDKTQVVMIPTVRTSVLITAAVTMMLPQKVQSGLLCLITSSSMRSCKRHTRRLA